MSEELETGHVDEDFARITWLYNGVGAVDVLAWMRGFFARAAVGLAGEQSQLWWVARRMSRLASEASSRIPEWTPTAARPSRFGLVWWEGGTGIDLPVETAVGDRPDGKWGVNSVEVGEIMGCVWTTDEEGMMTLIPIGRGAVGPFGAGPFGVGLALASFASWEPMPWSKTREATGFGAHLWPLLGATWLLAQSPTVGVVHNVRYDRRDPDRPFAKPALPGLITVVTLREIDYGSPVIDGVKRKPLDHQVLVRGFWRQQVCGPKRAWRKPVFIAPYVRGPAGTELVVKPVVHVWRR